ncbi:serine protease snake-like isoform X2 [Venturia canescens]|uniref:serine protease snake-like isoform X2 n=1 Tax=Venturia canescens TaxID=32260 RepID=UPI001C9C5E9B|nr:serine protease snake-like isoform X2 [Venturia canescens]
MCKRLALVPPLSSQRRSFLLCLRIKKTLNEFCEYIKIGERCIVFRCDGGNSQGFPRLNDAEASPVLRIGGGSNLVSKCGIVDTPLIIGGVRAKPLEFPHMAVIGYGDPVAWLCGGTLVSDLYVLTAAHCLDSSGQIPSKIRVGLTDLKNPESGMQERKVVERIAHPEYKIPARYHDIALLKIDKPLEMEAGVRPACLEVDSNLPLSQKQGAIASGFGRTSYGSSNGSRYLMKVSLNYVPAEDCAKHFSGESGGRRMSRGLIPNMLCAGVMEGGKDTCQGDSGGPLQRVLKDPYCAYSIVGVTSFGKFCGFKNSPAIYTRVSSYLDWIESVVWP